MIADEVSAQNPFLSRLDRSATFLYTRRDEFNKRFRGNFGFSPDADAVSILRTTAELDLRVLQPVIDKYVRNIKRCDSEERRAPVR